MSEASLINAVLRMICIILAGWMFVTAFMLRFAIHRRGKDCFLRRVGTALLVLAPFLSGTYCILGLWVENANLVKEMAWLAGSGGMLTWLARNYDSGIISELSRTGSWFYSQKELVQSGHNSH